MQFIIYHNCLVFPHTVSIYRLTSLGLGLVTQNDHIESVWTYQSVTASSHNRISCSLVPPKWSTNSSPKTSLAMLPFLVKRALASFNDFANLGPRPLSTPFFSPLPSGGTGISSFFSTPRRPRARMAAKTRKGLASAPATRTSNLVALGLAPGGAISRIDASRFSSPHETVTGAQRFSTRRL